MPSAPIPLHENLRLQDLWSYNIMDSEREKPFDDLVELAAAIYGCPVAYISFVDKDRQWYKAAKGLDGANNAPREDAMCAHTILEDDCVIVEDATKDHRFLDNPFVVGPYHVRFYVGAQIVSTSGQNIGTVCVVDSEPRNLTSEQANGLRIIARQVTQLLELRRKNENIKSRADLLIDNEKRIAQSVLVKQEEERNYVARELHENFAQSLAAVKIYLEYAKQSEEIREHFLGKSAERINQIIQELRNLSKSIVPTTLTSVGFKDAIGDLLLKYAKEEGWTTHFLCVQNLNFVKGETGLTLFRIVEEQLKNIREHAGATTVTVEIKQKNGIQLTISDNGAGIKMDSFRKGAGFDNIVTRVEHLRGTVTLQGQSKHAGCRLVAEIPT